MAITISLYVCAEVQADGLHPDKWQNTDAYRAFVVRLDESDPDQAVRKAEEAAAQMGLGPSEAAEMGETIRSIVRQMEKA